MVEQSSDHDILFDVETPLGFRVRTTIGHWDFITTVKHPVLRGREADIRATLASPSEVRLSKSDPTVYLFYRSDGTGRWVCAVTKWSNEEGFLITAYRTGNIKEGRHLWP